MHRLRHPAGWPFPALFLLLARMTGRHQADEGRAVDGGDFGVAAQVTLILASALLFFVSRTPSSETNYGGYGAF